MSEVDGEVVPPIPRPSTEQAAFNVALAAVIEFYNATVEDLRRQLAQAKRERDNWKSQVRGALR